MCVCVCVVCVCACLCVSLCHVSGGEQCAQVNALGEEGEEIRSPKK